MRLIAFFLFVLMSVPFQTSQLPSSPPQPLEPYLDQDAYDVYSSLLPEGWIWKEAKAEYLVIQEETITSNPLQADCGIKLAAESKGQWQSVLENFAEVNRKQRRLVRGFAIDKNYYLIKRDDIQKEFQKRGMNGWGSFYARYPRSGGYLFMSSVGFNAEKTRAIVSMNHWCGGLCGGGTYFFLEKKNGKWVKGNFKGTSCAWAS